MLSRNSMPDLQFNKLGGTRKFTAKTFRSNLVVYTLFYKHIEPLDLEKLSTYEKKAHIASQFCLLRLKIKHMDLFSEAIDFSRKIKHIHVLKCASGKKSHVLI